MKTKSVISLSTGLEDAVYIDRGTLAPSNAAMVEKARLIIEQLGAQIATPVQARALFDLPSTGSGSRRVP